MTTIHKAALDTPNFHFEALGTSIPNALAALELGLVKHAKANIRTTNPEQFAAAIIGNAVVVSMIVGQTYRDRELVK